MSNVLASPQLRIHRLSRDLETAQRRIRDLEHHLQAAIDHIAAEHRPPAHILEPSLKTLLEKK